MKIQAGESTHFYKQDGSPCYTVPYADPKKGMRNTTLRDARKLNLVPSVTTILKVPAKPALEKWKRDQLLMSALTLPKIKGETLTAFQARVVEDSYKQAQEAAERGKAIHASLEKDYEDKDYDLDHHVYVRAVREALEEAYGLQNWIAEKSFSHASGYGGKVDLHCPIAIVDFKTKEFGDENLPKAFDEQKLQLAAYRHGLGLPDAKLVNVFISVSNPGLVHIVEHEEGSWLERFELLLKYWQLNANYDSSWEVE